jgi:hypothetical protein
MDESVDRIHFHYALALLSNNDNTKGCEQLQMAVKHNEGEISEELKKRCQ